MGGGGGGGGGGDLNGGPRKKNMVLKRDREGRRKIVGLRGVTKKIFKFFSDGICYNANSLQENRRFWHSESSNFPGVKISDFGLRVFTHTIIG